MPTPKKGPRLGGSPAHQRLILSNLATQLFEHGRITTTETRARTLRPLAEKLITKAKTRATCTTVARCCGPCATSPSCTPSSPRSRRRSPSVPGGYTRITKIGPRKGDNAPMAVIELVTEPYSPKPAVEARRPAPAARRLRSRRSRPLRRLRPRLRSTRPPRSRRLRSRRPTAEEPAEETAEAAAEEPAAESAEDSESKDA